MSELIEQTQSSSEPPHETQAETVLPQQEGGRAASSRLLTAGFAILLVCLIALIAMLALPSRMMDAPVSGSDASLTAMTARLDVLESRTHKVEADLAAVKNTQSAPSSSAEGQSSSALASGDEIETLKAGLLGLSGALSLLQQELEKSAKVTNEDRLNTQAGLATIISFFQMERLARQGLPFEKDRLVMRKLADSDQVLVDHLISLEPHAVQGVATPAKLYKEWRGRASQAQAALRKSAAQSWVDRIVVALEGLVSIRSVAPGAGESLSFAGITMDLDDGNLASAVQKAEALPPEVQAEIKGWLDLARARLAVETTLNAMNEHLIERGAASVEPMATPVPPVTEGEGQPAPVLAPVAGGAE